MIPFEKAAVVVLDSVCIQRANDSKITFIVSPFYTFWHFNYIYSYLKVYVGVLKITIPMHTSTFP